MVEIPPTLLARASVFVDHTDACWAEAGEVIVARSEGLIRSEDVRELGEVVLGVHQGRSNQDEVTIFKSVGIACQDAVASSLVVAAAKRLGVGTTIDF
jgi:ornithine cyclodeaminase/alanine dehydrogenase-like protein (mu-crystallin family)